MLVYITSTLTVAICIAFDLDYAGIAQSGLTLSSIVVAVYIAAIVGLINSDLSKEMQRSVSHSQPDRTQLGILTTYFKLAIFFSIGTIILSSFILLITVPEEPTKIFICANKVLSIAGMVFYVENLVFLIPITQFMLNRQVWDD